MAICFILILGFVLRFIGLDFGLPYLYEYDEHYAWNALYMNHSGDFNPHWFGHPGSFLMYSLAALFALITAVYFYFCFLSGRVHSVEEFDLFIKNSPLFYFGDNPVLFFFSARLLQVSFALTTIYLVYLSAKRVFNKQVGLLAAFCLSIAPLHIEFSRIIRTDMSATMLIMFTVYFLIRAFEGKADKKFLILASLFAGFAMSSRYIAAIVAFPILVYCVTFDYQAGALLKPKYILDCLKFKTNLSKVLLFIFIGFFLFAPFVILDFGNVMKDVKFELRGTQLGVERLPGIQNHLWYFKNAFKDGIGGVFFEVFAALGLSLVLLRKQTKKYLFLLFPIVFFLIIGCGKLKWSRWAIPVLPFEAVLFGVGFFGTYEFLMRMEVLRKFKVVTISLFALALIFASYPTVASDVKEGVRLSRTDSRTLAKHWAEENLPDGSIIAYEHFAPHLAVKPKRNFTILDFKWYSIVSKPLSFYLDNQVDYIIITDYFKQKYNEPKRFAVEIARYEDLKNKTELLKVFNYQDNPGPVIEIYKLPKLQVIE